MDTKKIIIASVIGLVSGLAIGFLLNKNKTEKKSSAEGDGEFRKGNYEKAW